MSDPLHSAHWYRVSALRPALRAHLRLVRQAYRGEPWYVIHDPASGRNWRFSAAAERVIRLMDGRRSVEDIWTLCSQSGGDLPSQDEIVRLLAELHQAEALAVDADPDVRVTCGAASVIRSRFACGCSIPTRSSSARCRLFGRCSAPGAPARGC